MEPNAASCGVEGPWGGQVVSLRPGWKVELPKEEAQGTFPERANKCQEQSSRSLEPAHMLRPPNSPSCVTSLEN